MTSTISRDVMVAMRDGVRLATDIYLPPEAASGPVPVLLERTPYDKRGTNHGDRTAIDPEPRAKPEIAAQFVAAGYAYVLQDCRGRFGSEGTFVKYLNEAEDGYDTLAWLIEQPWCNGKIGTLGLSYCAHVQAALATLDPPGLAAMVLDCGGFSDAYQGGVRQGGAFELKQLTWAYSQALEAAVADGDTERAAAIAAEDIGEWVRVNPWSEGHSPVAAAPDYENYVLEQWRHEVFSPFWQRRGLYWRGYYGETADVPMIHMSGWYDPYSQTAIDNFAGLRGAGRQGMKLVLGPWTHGQRSVSHAGDVEFGPEAPLDAGIAPDFVTLRRHWFDQHLRGSEPSPYLPDPVTLFVMGGGSGRRTADGRLDHGGQWRGEADWPPPAMVPTRFHFHPDRRLAEPVPAAGVLGYDADPTRPVPTIGGAVTSGAPLMAAGAYDQRECEGLYGATQPGRALSDRADLLSFETLPLEEDVELTGPIVAHLFVSSSAVDTDFTVKVMDVYPPSADYPEGFAMNLSHGILRARYRNTFEAPQPMEPGTVYPIEVHAFPTSNLFARGHRIRVDIASSNFPHFDVNPNTDWRVAGQAPQSARNTLHMGPEHPSHIVLPVMPRDVG